MTKKVDIKLVLIVAGILVALVAAIAGMFISTNNRAIGLEEQIYESAASINVQEKRRVDLVYNLADTVEQYAKHERSTLTELTEARTQAQSGNVEQASVMLNAVAEAYPELKADQTYMQLMTELSLTENMIAQYRENYNHQVRSYNKYVRKFPARSILDAMGYEVLDFSYTDYDAPEDAPQNLFGE